MTNGRQFYTGWIPKKKKLKAGWAQAPEGEECCLWCHPIFALGAMAQLMRSNRDMTIAGCLWCHPQYDAESKSRFLLGRLRLHQLFVPRFWSLIFTQEGRTNRDEKGKTNQDSTIKVF
jgi:hypothetical protein